MTLHSLYKMKNILMAEFTATKDEDLQETLAYFLEAVADEVEYAKERQREGHLPQGEDDDFDN